MQGPIFQSVALTLWGNAVLLSADRGGLAPIGSVLPADHSTRRDCASIRFVTLHPDGRRWQEQVYAHTPEQWLTRLRSEGVTRLRLHYLSTPPDTGTGAPHGSPQPGAAPDSQPRGERWLIEAAHPGGSDIWQGRWHRGPGEATAALPEHLWTDRIWSATYGRIAQGFRPPPVDLIHPVRLHDSLSDTVQGCLALARRHDHLRAVTLFDLALRKLTSQTPEAGLTYPDLLPPSAPEADTLPVRRLLACAQMLWDTARDPLPAEPPATMTGEEWANWTALHHALRQGLIQAVLYAANREPVFDRTDRTAGRWRRWWPFR